jgi:hypothetical protein
LDVGIKPLGQIKLPILPHSLDPSQKNVDPTLDTNPNTCDMM